ncbi:U1 small nuclear ribonucleoprotein 70 kDa-like [Xenia sp. Carnegie-2017]|uniref:U1 small nuclear ribonucleoprotein 70 kDa-like n=1 Tax=Xenia sp. Carnegie-2017 TaxID=2897299 RepID=UPI001F0392DF|nr:U1 small nuclear ribonucleoprotein 70 kDa-like [Xenia sp. Carnegie-2017]
MTAFLPSNLLALFAARPPIPYLPPLDKLGHQKKPWPYSGIASIVADFEDPEDTPSPTRAETRVEKIERKGILTLMAPMHLKLYLLED